MQGTLGSKTQSRHDFPQCRQAQLRAELPLDQLPNQAQRPQSKIKSQLIGCVTK
jgi:hypothetical protein